MGYNTFSGLSPYRAEDASVDKPIATPIRGLSAIVTLPAGLWPCNVLQRLLTAVQGTEARITGTYSGRSR